ncbi:uncharacterized protein MELLADRAFT_95729 [Melampsora larici-populina 98AG31]|uniref:Uncharacterized protein n=1 Tax=Melampsora larici-populina (strain 98AG31 / pathotype 3-4-7) TaxID=747676 RepID=F4SAE2_MELLP|nr:uncharacterized protein MELLADRAFT_95729 [Melampsora larici-populina 98AG31]EGF98391.1 hypothetical protein MELLADRAFT_95729 [Melampsora larici-populina 98AG31]
MLDPSATGVTKQMMLDWLRINHPMTPVSSHSLKAFVAELVRKKQPEFFADPTSDAPAVIPDGSQSDTQNPFETNITVFADPESDAPAVIPGGSQPDTPNPFQTNHTVFSVPPQAVLEPEVTEQQAHLHDSLHEVPRSSTVSIRPAKRSGSPTFSGKPSKRSTFGVSQLSNASEHHVKRPASPTTHEPLPKRANIGDQGLLPRKPSKKGRKTLRQSYPSGGSSRSAHRDSSMTASLVKGSDINLLDRGSEEDLNALLGYEVTPMESSNLFAVDRFSSPMNEMKNIINTPENPGTRDLIDFSSVDLLLVENLAVITQDAPLSKIPTLVKSGVDAFQEERRRAETVVSELEKSVSCLLNRMDLMEEKSAAHIVEHEQQRYEQDHALQQATCRLDKQAKCIDELRDTVSSLKQQLDVLHRRLNRAEEDIGTQERCIVRLMQQDEGSDGEEAYPGIDSQSDYSV